MDGLKGFGATQKVEIGTWRARARHGKRDRCPPPSAIGSIKGCSELP